MARAIDMTQVSSKGKNRPYQSVYEEVQGKPEVGDTLLLRDGAFTITAVGPTWKNKTGQTETEVRLQPKVAD